MPTQHPTIPGPKAMVSWTRPSGPEPVGLWEQVPSGSRFAGCAVPELCSQKPCGDMTNPKLSAPTWKPQLTSGTQGRLPLDLWPSSLWPALICCWEVLKECPWFADKGLSLGFVVSWNDVLSGQIIKQTFFKERRNAEAGTAFKDTTTRPPASPVTLHGWVEKLG